MTDLSPMDRRWLDAAIRHASAFLGTTGKHAAVGAIVVEPNSQALLGRAVTGLGGAPRAAVTALEEAGHEARGATLYLTLGITMFDAECVVRAGIRRVVVGIADPHVDSTGSGLDLLKKTGIEASVTDHPPAKRLHEGYLSLAVRRRPFVSAALAVSDDGRFALAGTHAPRLTESAQRWRDMQIILADAVLLSWTTAQADLPLDVSLSGFEGRRPLLVLIAGRRTNDPKPSAGAARKSQALVIATLEKRIELPRGVELLRVKGVQARPDLGQALDALGERGIQNLFVETGATLLESLLAAGLVDRFHLVRSETEPGSQGMPVGGRGGIAGRIGVAGFSLVDHRLLGADNLRTFERIF